MQTGEKIMRVVLRVRNTDLTEALSDYIDRRLRIAFGRVEEQVDRVRVKVSGLNGPRGGTRKSCRISVRFRPFGRVAVQETDLDLHSAIDRAANRVARLLSQRLEKAKALGREAEKAAA